MGDRAGLLAAALAAETDDLKAFVAFADLKDEIEPIEKKVK